MTEEGAAPPSTHIETVCWECEVDISVAVIDVKSCVEPMGLMVEGGPNDVARKVPVVSLQVPTECAVVTSFLLSLPFSSCQLSYAEGNSYVEALLPRRA